MTVPWMVVVQLDPSLVDASCPPDELPEEPPEVPLDDPLLPPDEPPLDEPLPPPEEPPPDDPLPPSSPSRSFPFAPLHAGRARAVTAALARASKASACARDRRTVRIGG
jgi:hypothetical protein